MPHSERIGLHSGCALLGRRGFLRISTSATAIGLLGGALRIDRAFADALTREQRDALTPDGILAGLKQGNERFRAGKPTSRNYLKEQQTSCLLYTSPSPRDS